MRQLPGKCDAWMIEFAETEIALDGRCDVYGLVLHFAGLMNSFNTTG